MNWQTCYIGEINQYTICIFKFFWIVLYRSLLFEMFFKLLLSFQCRILRLFFKSRNLWCLSRNRLKLKSKILKRLRNLAKPWHHGIATPTLWNTALNHLLTFSNFIRHIQKVIQYFLSLLKDIKFFFVLSFNNFSPNQTKFDARIKYLSRIRSKIKI